MVTELLGLAVGVLMALKRKSAARDFVAFQRRMVPSWIVPGAERRAEIGYLIGGMIMIVVAAIFLFDEVRPVAH